MFYDEKPIGEKGYFIGEKGLYLIREMDRHLHKKYIPICPTYVRPVDQYMWKEPDTTMQQCYNGISHTVYDALGNLSYTLPLEFYPPESKVHQQVLDSAKGHLPRRSSDLSY